MEILKADSTARKLFFDLAAKGRKDMPADIAKWVIDNPKAIESIRNRMDQSSTGGQKMDEIKEGYIIDYISGLQVKETPEEVEAVAALF